MSTTCPTDRSSTLSKQTVDKAPISFQIPDSVFLELNALNNYCADSTQCRDVWGCREWKN